MLASLTQSLARLITPRQKANPAGEGNWHPGPYTVSGGWLPAGAPLNFWQCDIDPIPAGGCSTVEACVWAYIRAIAQLPGYHRRELGNGGTESVTTSALSRLLRAPNGYMTPSDFLVHLIRSLLYCGNSYWIAQRNDRQEVEALHWTDPRASWVRQVRVPGQVFSEIFYEFGDNPLVNVTSLAGNRLIVPARDVLHIKLDTRRNPLIGETWLSALAPELATRSAIQGAAATFSTNMSRPSGVLTSDLQLKAPDVEILRQRWNEHSKGLNAGGVPILTHGLKFQPISISNEDAQVVDQLKLNDRTIASVFGVPAILLGFTDVGTQKSAEALMTEWLASGLGFIITHIEQAFDKFIGLDKVPAGREWTELDTRVLLRSMFKERIDGLVRGVQGGIYSPNEARALEGYHAVEAGDEPRVQQQVVPLSFATTPPVPPPAAQPAAPPPPVEDRDEPAEPEVDEEERAALTMFQLQREMSHVRAAA
ncbi:MAG: phage portal protein [Hyphomicrobiaceae bacterium]|nr:MAG: phage portal protein [Hyphomicrobiaceae bacterium]